MSARCAAGLCGLRPVPTSLSRPFGFNPSRLRACGAARCACLQGKALRAIPAARCLAPLDTAEPAYAGSARPAPHRDGRGTGEHAGACCGRLCKCRPSSTLAVRTHHVTKDGSRQFTVCLSGIAMELPRHASRPAPQDVAEAFSPVVAGLTWPASAGEPEKPSGGDAELAPSPFGAVRPKASLCCCES